MSKDELARAAESETFHASVAKVAKAEFDTIVQESAGESFPDRGRFRLAEWARTYAPVLFRHLEALEENPGSSALRQELDALHHRHAAACERISTLARMYSDEILRNPPDFLCHAYETGWVIEVPSVGFAAIPNGAEPAISQLPDSNPRFYLAEDPVISNAFLTLDPSCAVYFQSSDAANAALKWAAASVPGTAVIVAGAPGLPDYVKRGPGLYNEAANAAMARVTALEARLKPGPDGDQIDVLTKAVVKAERETADLVIKHDRMKIDFDKLLTAMIAMEQRAKQYAAALTESLHEFRRLTR